MEIKIPKKPNYTVNNPDRYIIFIKMLLDDRDKLYDKTTKKYLPRVTDIFFNNEYKYKNMIDINNPFFYKKLRDGYISVLEFEKNLSGHTIKIIRYDK